ncbi:HNH endonuclease [Peijinzhouia sedimentorum]
MNRALDIKNHTDGGNNYVLRASSKNKWSGFQESVISKLSAYFGDKFNIVIWTDVKEEADYYCIPFKVIKHLFIDEHKTTGKYPNRWTAIILNHKFLMHSNSDLSVDISAYYSLPFIQETTFDVSDDYFIENAKAEINIRLGQSKFRKGVLDNFGGQCALTEISEPSLLTASHIVPWSHNKNYRGDISNGICLYIEIDALFDKGYISFTNNLEIIILSDTSKLSKALLERLKSLKGKQLNTPKNKELNMCYLEYHRNEIFKK